MPVLWKGRAGVFRRDVGDGEHAEVVMDGRIYRVRTSERARMYYHGPGEVLYSTVARMSLKAVV
jgi:hypothetical protein